MKPARSQDKIVSIDDLMERLESARAQGESIVFTNGCFDLLHRGHVRSLEEAHCLGDRLVVAINSDASVQRAKGPDRPILEARDRMEIVASLECVDWVVGFSSDTPIELIERTRPDVLAKGGDWALDQIVGHEFVEAAGGRVVRLREIVGARTSDLVARIRESKADKNP